MGCYSLLQGIFPTQGLNPGFLHFRQILYYLSHQGSPDSHRGQCKFRHHLKPRLPSCGLILTLCLQVSTEEAQGGSWMCCALWNPQGGFLPVVLNTHLDRSTNSFLVSFMKHLLYMRDVIHFLLSLYVPLMFPFTSDRLPCPLHSSFSYCSGNSKRAWLAIVQGIQLLSLAGVSIRLWWGAVASAPS